MTLCFFGKHEMEEDGDSLTGRLYEKSYYFQRPFGLLGVFPSSIKSHAFRRQPFTPHWPKSLTTIL